MLVDFKKRILKKTYMGLKTHLHLEPLVVIVVVVSVVVVGHVEVVICCYHVRCHSGHGGCHYCMYSLFVKNH